MCDVRMNQRQRVSLLCNSIKHRTLFCRPGAPMHVAQQRKGREKEEPRIKTYALLQERPHASCIFVGVFIYPFESRRREEHTHEHTSYNKYTQTHASTKKEASTRARPWRGNHRSRSIACHDKVWRHCPSLYPTTTLLANNYGKPANSDTRESKRDRVRSTWSVLAPPCRQKLQGT